MSDVSDDSAIKKKGVAMDFFQAVDEAQKHGRAIRKKGWPKGHFILWRSDLGQFMWNNCVFCNIAVKLTELNSEWECCSNPCILRTPAAVLELLHRRRIVFYVDQEGTPSAKMLAPSGFIVDANGDEAALLLTRKHFYAPDVTPTGKYWCVYE